MKIQVIEPQVFLPDVAYARKELARCACMAALSRGKLLAFNVAGEIISCTGVVGAPGLPKTVEVQPFGDAEAMIGRLLGFKPFPHDSVLEHGNFGVTFRISRIATHELVRHRLGGITQESTRYVGYNKDETVVLIKPMGAPDELLGDYDEGAAQYTASDWVLESFRALDNYGRHIERGMKREDARYKLPHELAAWIGYTTNFRQWRHMVAMRDQKKAAPEMQFVFGKVRRFLERVSPVLVTHMEGER